MLKRVFQMGRMKDGFGHVSSQLQDILDEDKVAV